RRASTCVGLTTKSPSLIGAVSSAVYGTVRLANDGEFSLSSTFIDALLHRVLSPEPWQTSTQRLFQVVPPPPWSTKAVRLPRASRSKRVTCRKGSVHGTSCRRLASFMPQNIPGIPPANTHRTPRNPGGLGRLV